MNYHAVSSWLSKNGEQTADVCKKHHTSKNNTKKTMPYHSIPYDTVRFHAIPYLVPYTIPYHFRGICTPEGAQRNIQHIHNDLVRCTLANWEAARRTRLRKNVKTRVKARHTRYSLGQFAIGGGWLTTYSRKCLTHSVYETNRSMPNLYLKPTPMPVRLNQLSYAVCVKHFLEHYR